MEFTRVQSLWIIDKHPYCPEHVVYSQINPMWKYWLYYLCSHFIPYDKLLHGTGHCVCSHHSHPFVLAPQRNEIKPAVSRDILRVLFPVESREFLECRRSWVHRKVLKIVKTGATCMQFKMQWKSYISFRVFKDICLYENKCTKGVLKLMIDRYLTFRFYRNRWNFEDCIFFECMYLNL